MLLGYLIQYRGHHELIAGYNTASPEEQARCDVKRLGAAVGKGLFATAGVLLDAAHRCGP